MIELPEAQTLAHQITQQLSGKTILSSAAAQSPHKFAWYHGDPAGYPAKLNGGKVLAARGIGMFMEITLSSATLLFSDGVNLRLHPAAGLIPAKHQLLLNFEDGSSLSASVAMYGGVVCWAEGENYENSYYATALSKPSPLTDAFDEAYFLALLAPVLDIAKTPDAGAMTAGSPTSWTIAVTNTGAAVAHDVTVTDVLPTGTTYTPGAASVVPSGGFTETSVTPGPAVGQTTVVWTLASVAAGATRTITVPVGTDQDLASGTTLTNSASATALDAPPVVLEAWMISNILRKV